MKFRAGALFLWGLAVLLAAFLSQSPGQASPSPSSVDPLSRFLGSAKEAFGDTLFLKADAYFHGGVVESSHRDDTPEALRREGMLEPESHGVLAPRDWIEKIGREIRVGEPRHLSRTERKEMLPFFAMAVALDPRNIEAVLTSAYWLENEFGKADEAAEVLKKGLRDNPGSWEIENALGRLYFRRRDFEGAAAHLSAAAERSRGAELENYERVDLFHHLAESNELIGNQEKALDAYREAAKYFDDRTTPFFQNVILDKIRQNAE